MPTRRQFLSAVPAALTLFAAGCSAPTAPGSGPSDSLLLADGFEPDSLHPLLGYAQEGAGKFYDGLLAFDGRGEMRPALATALP